MNLKITIALVIFLIIISVTSIILTLYTQIPEQKPPELQNVTSTSSTSITNGISAERVGKWVKRIPDVDFISNKGAFNVIIRENDLVSKSFTVIERTQVFEGLTPNPDFTLIFSLHGFEIAEQSVDICETLRELRASGDYQPRQNACSGTFTLRYHKIRGCLGLNG
ncbi:MAG: hypothetical protein ABH851_09515 [Methanobacteriota archaeon]